MNIMIMRELFKPKLSLCSALNENAQDKLKDLDYRLFEFYNGYSEKKYFEKAESTGGLWTLEMKSHCHLKNAINDGSTVVDLGCGTAHACRNLREKSIQYTGIDWSLKQIKRNSLKMPEHSFINSSLYGTPLKDSVFDVAISLFVIEHLVWPHKFLDEAWRIVRPGGLIGIMCPPFRIENTIKSFRFGLSAQPFFEKIKTGRFIDAVLHLIQHRLIYPLYLRKFYQDNLNQNSFLINLQPVCLEHGKYFPDADAIYFADTNEIGDYIANLGGSVVEEWPKEGYLLMQKSE